MGLVLRPRVRGGWYLTRQGWQLLHPAENPPYPLVDVTIQADCSNFAEENGMDSADSGMETRNDGADSSATTQPDSADSGKDNATDSADSDWKSAEKRGIALKEEEIEIN